MLSALLSAGLAGLILASGGLLGCAAKVEGRLSGSLIEDHE